MKAQVYGLSDDTFKRRTVWCLRKVDALGLCIRNPSCVVLRSFINYWIITSDVKKSCSTNEKQKKDRLHAVEQKF